MNKKRLTRRDFIRMAALASFSPTLPRFSVPHVELEGLGLEFVQAASPPVGVPYWAASRSGDESGNLLYLVATAGGSIRAGRQVLTDHLDLYVRTDGSDSNDGLSDSSGGALATVNYAIDRAAALDLSIYNARINLGAGTFTENIVCKSAIGNGQIQLLGSGVGVTTLACVGGLLIDAQNMINTVYRVEGFSAVGTGAAGALSARYGSALTFGNIDFGSGFSSHIRCNDQATIAVVGPYSISGSATRHLLASNLCDVRIFNQTITLIGSPAFSVAYADVSSLSLFSAYGCTFVGSATGSRFAVTTNSVLNTNGGGANYLPGNAAGTTSSGGIYV